MCKVGVVDLLHKIVVNIKQNNSYEILSTVCSIEYNNQHISSFVVY